MTLFEKHSFNEQEERERLAKLSEKELLIEMIIELKNIKDKCSSIKRSI